MEHIRDFLITNFPLLIILVGMIFVVLYDFKVRKRVGSYIIGIICFAFVLAIFLEVEHYAIAMKNIPLVTVFAFLGYTLRPMVIILFILLGAGKPKKIHLYLIIPIVLNIVVYSLALFINTDAGKLVFYYAYTEDGSTIEHHRGSFLNFTSHIVSLLLLSLLIVQSVRKIKSKHSLDSVAILSCAGFTIIAVLVESFANRSGLLNNTIAVSCMFYYLFLFNEMNRRDALTELYDRKTFYADEKRFGKDVKGIIHVDMNGLKILNDNNGHEQGDLALKTLAKVMKNNIRKDMYAYRIGGDEFVILCINEDEQAIVDTIKLMKEKLSETPYSASFGHGMRKDESDTIDSMLKSAETEMYNDKNNFYTTHKIDRRRR